MQIELAAEAFGVQANTTKPDKTTNSFLIMGFGTAMLMPKARSIGDHRHPLSH